MGIDPDKLYEAVREERGEAAAARAVIHASKRIVVMFAIVLVLAVGGYIMMADYAQGRVDTCRTVIEDRYWASIGDVIVEYREVGTLSDETFADFDTKRDRIDNIETLCPSGFWPWDLPEPPPAD